MKSNRSSMSLRICWMSNESLLIFIRIKTSWVFSLLQNIYFNCYCHSSVISLHLHELQLNMSNFISCFFTQGLGRPTTTNISPTKSSMKSIPTFAMCLQVSGSEKTIRCVRLMHRSSIQSVIGRSFVIFRSSVYFQILLPLTSSYLIVFFYSWHYFQNCRWQSFLTIALSGVPGAMQHMVWVPRWFPSTRPRQRKTGSIFCMTALPRCCLSRQKPFTSKHKHILRVETFLI